MQANGLDERSLRDGRYDGILHLVTAACGAEEHYSLENNEVRSESVEVAKDVRACGLLLPCAFVVCTRAHPVVWEPPSPGNRNQAVVFTLPYESPRRLDRSDWSFCDRSLVAWRVMK